MEEPDGLVQVEDIIFLVRKYKISEGQKFFDNEQRIKNSTKKKRLTYYIFYIYGLINTHITFRVSQKIVTNFSGL